ncbi:ABC transporter substrate-binding protein [Sinomonas terrae]|uniref:ABC transporter substrate-binding protein n=1 Tax=Sinomonas terrae TaxID=2908838 RepID=A0ABS9U0I3_9MICC|nr:ABC transporter substrate-binding protein [Sinomonas terrae]MCH6470184.1 ABC transporter substrate-binding protein [Sinomonas terrae]
MPKKNMMGALAAAAAVALTAAGCTSHGPSGGGSAAAKNSLTVAVAATPTSYDLDGSFAASNENYTMWSQTQIGLLNYKTTTKNGVVTTDFTHFEGALADKDNPYTVSDNGQTYTFHLRKGVLSQAGNPFTAQDVYWSVQRKLSDRGVGLTQIRNYFNSMDQIQIVDDYTIAFHLHNAGNDNVFLPIFTGQTGRIYDKTEMLKHATSSDPWAVKWAAQNTGWGYGPYTVSSVTQGQQLVLKANPNYPDGHPAFTTITMKVVPDSGTRAQLLSSGNVDVAEALAPSDLSSIKDSPKVQEPRVDHPIEFDDISLVQNKAPFDDKLVRQAFNYAIPYDKIISQVYEGFAVPSPGWFTPTMGVPGLSTQPAYTYDVNKAKALLAQDGKTNVNVTLSVSNAIPDIVDTAIMIGSYAKAAGFNVTVNQLNPADFATGRLKQTLQALIAANRVQVQVPSFVNNFFLPGDPSNSGAFVPNPQWQSLLSAAINAGPGTSEQAAPYWQKVNDYINQDASQLPMLYKQPNQAYSKSLENMSYRYDSTVDYSILKPAGS